MVPIRSTDLLGAIGTYWAERHRPTRRRHAMYAAKHDGRTPALI